MLEFLRIGLFLLILLERLCFVVDFYEIFGKIILTNFRIIFKLIGGKTFTGEAEIGCFKIKNCVDDFIVRVELFIFRGVNRSLFAIL